MKFFNDFKSSLIKGDVLALATAVVIGGAFGKIVTSAVNDVIMPIIGLITGGIDFTQKFITLDGNTYVNLEAAQKAGAAVITYGNLVQATINFVIVAFFVFVILRAAEKTKNKKEVVVTAPTGPSQEELLTQIRDLLKK
ncbi:large conductance mechanosensitive channel protein MscL [Flavobacterium sp. Arc3]|jgi:large conductance mechanosensitive channel|uniref:large conductance mechanosensitive channel protein MscL n=1 Tax=unclassified Flavobacterium TaxID=196869 RepID=UPI00352E72A7